MFLQQAIRPGDSKDLSAVKILSLPSTVAFRRKTQTPHGRAVVRSGRLKSSLISLPRLRQAQRAFTSASPLNTPSLEVSPSGCISSTTGDQRPETLASA